MVGIYTITSPTNKVYVGQSWDLVGRLKKYGQLHIKDQPGIYNSLIKHGVDGHKFEIAIELRDDISQATLDCWEEYYYDLYKANHELLNSKLPGSHGKHTEETKIKIGDSNKGKQRSPETLLKLSVARRKRKTSQQTKDKMSASQKKRFAVDENKTYLIERFSGENNPMFGKKGKNHPRYGKPRSKKTRLKISKANKGKKRSEEVKQGISDRAVSRNLRGVNHHNSKAVLQYSLDGNFIKEWGFIREAAKELGITNISSCCKNKLKSCGGFIWKYKEKEVTCQ